MCLLLQYLLSSCSREGRGIVKDICYEPGTSTQGAPVFPGSSRVGIEPKTPGWLVQDRTTSPSGIWSPPWAGRGASSARRIVEDMCVFITAVPIFTRDDEPRPVWTSLPITH